METLPTIMPFVLDTIGRAGAAVVDRDIDQLVHCYHPDGHFSYAPDLPVIVGRDAIREFMTGSPKWDAPGARFHVHATTSLEEVGEDLAISTRTAGISVWQDESGTISVRGLKYLDDFVRHDDRWLFMCRRHFVEWEFVQ